MAWAEKLASGNYRGGYRRPGSTRKYYVDGTFARKRDAREAAQEAEVRARRETQKREGKLTGRTTWGRLVGSDSAVPHIRVRLRRSRAHDR
jgi:hypothetical protein